MIIFKVILVLIYLLNHYIVYGQKQLEYITIFLDEGQIVPTQLKTKTEAEWSDHAKIKNGKLTLITDEHTALKSFGTAFKTKYSSLLVSPDDFQFHCISERLSSIDAIGAFAFNVRMSITESKDVFHHPSVVLDANDKCDTRDMLVIMARDRSTGYQSMIKGDQYKQLMIRLKTYAKFDVNEANFLDIVNELEVEEKVFRQAGADQLVKDSEPFVNQTFRSSMGLLDEKIEYKGVDIGVEIQKSRMSKVFEPIYTSVAAKKRLNTTTRLDAYATVSTTIYSILIEFGLDKYVNQLDDYSPHAASSIIFEFYDNLQNFKLIRTKMDSTNQVEFIDLTKYINGCDDYCNVEMIEKAGKWYQDHPFNCSITDPEALNKPTPALSLTPTSDTKVEESDECACSIKNRPSYCKHDCSSFHEWFRLIFGACLFFTIASCLACGFLIFLFNKNRAKDDAPKLTEEEDMLNKKMIEMNKDTDMKTMEIQNGMKNNEGMNKIVGENKAKLETMDEEYEADRKKFDEQVREERDELEKKQRDEQILIDQLTTRYGLAKECFLRIIHSLPSVSISQLFTSADKLEEEVQKLGHELIPGGVKCHEYKLVALKLRKFEFDANFVQIGNNVRFICTKTPKKKTKDAFWVMVNHWKVTAIIMLEDDDKHYTDQYYNSPEKTLSVEAFDKHCNVTVGEESNLDMVSNIIQTKFTIGEPRSKTTESVIYKVIDSKNVHSMRLIRENIKNDKLVVVHCPDGATGCMEFVLHDLLKSYILLGNDDACKDALMQCRMTRMKAGRSESAFKRILRNVLRELMQDANFRKLLSADDLIQYEKWMEDSEEMDYNEYIQKVAEDQ